MQTEHQNKYRKEISSATNTERERERETRMSNAISNMHNPLISLLKEFLNTYRMS